MVYIYKAVSLFCSYDIMKSVLTHIYIMIFVFIQTTHHEWFLQTPKAMWSIVVKTFVHISE